jgi:hypothetical protein
MGGERWLVMGLVHQTEEITVWNEGPMKDDPEMFLFLCHLTTKRGIATGWLYFSRTGLLDMMVDVADAMLSLANNAVEEMPDPI